MTKPKMNLMYTPTTLKASSKVSGMATSTSDEEVDIPTPDAAMRAFQCGFQTFSGEDFIDGERKKTFNEMPLLPANSRASPKALFDLEKIKKLVPTIIAHKAPLWIDVMEVTTELSEYISAHNDSLNFTVPTTVIKGSFKKEMTTSYTSKVMFTKKQRTASVGYAKLHPPDGESFYDLLTQNAKEDLEEVDGHDSALRFYKDYGTDFFYEVGLGAFVHLTGAVQLMHTTSKSDINSKLSGPEIFGKAAVNGSIMLNFKKDLVDSFQSMNCRAIGGDISKVKDRTAYGASAFEKPDIISYKIRKIFHIIEDDKLRAIMKKAYFELMKELHDTLIPDFPEIPDREAGWYDIHYQWNNTNFNPLDAESLTVTLTYKGKLVDSITHNRKDAFRWRSKVQKPGGEFGAGEWSGATSFQSTKVLGSNSLNLASNDLRHKLE